MFQSLKASPSTPVRLVKSESSGPFYNENWNWNVNEFSLLHRLKNDVISPEFIGNNILKTISNSTQCNEEDFCQCSEPHMSTDVLYDAKENIIYDGQPKKVVQEQLKGLESSRGFKQLYPWPLSSCRPVSNILYDTDSKEVPIMGLNSRRELEKFEDLYPLPNNQLKNHCNENECEIIYPKSETSSEDLCLRIETDPIMVYPRQEADVCDLSTQKYSVQTKVEIRPKCCRCGCSTENDGIRNDGTKEGVFLYPPQERSSCQQYREPSLYDRFKSQPDSNLRKWHTPNKIKWAENTGLDLGEMELSESNQQSFMSLSRCRSHSYYDLHSAKSNDSCQDWICSPILDGCVDCDFEHGYGNISNFGITELLQKLESLGQNVNNKQPVYNNQFYQ